MAGQEPHFTLNAYRLTPAGKLDATFGSSGVAAVSFADFGFMTAQAQGNNNIAPVYNSSGSTSPDGYVLVGAVASSTPFGSTACVAIAKLSADGTPDTSFGVTSFNGTSVQGGRVVLGIGTDCGARTVIVDPETTKIYVAGYADGNFLVIRLTSTGQLDTSFGDFSASGGRTGYTTVDFGRSACAMSLVLQGGRLYVGGTSRSGPSFGAVAVLKVGVSDFGQLDTTFGTVSGTTRTGTFTREMFVGDVSMAVSASGKVYMTGQGWDSASSAYRAAVLALTPSGDLDTSFGQGAGWEYVGGVNGGRGYNGIVALPDYIDSTGKSVPGALLALRSEAVAGGAAGETVFSVTRLTSSGALDTTYGSGGTASVDIELNDSPGAAVLADGRVVVAGTSWPQNGYGNEDITLTRLNGDWSPKTRTYARQDANFNVTSTITLGGSKDGNGVLTGSVERYEYTPYGVRTVLNPDFSSKTGGSTLSGNGGAGFNYGFQGGRVDATIGASGMYNFRHRWYDPTQGRWTQEDPLGPSFGGNLQGINSGSPCRYLDPLGLAEVETDNIKTAIDAVARTLETVARGALVRAYQQLYQTAQGIQELKKLAELFECSFPGQRHSYSRWIAEAGITADAHIDFYLVASTWWGGKQKQKILGLDAKGKFSLTTEAKLTVRCSCRSDGKLWPVPEKVELVNTKMEGKWTFTFDVLTAEGAAIAAATPDLKATYRNPEPLLVWTNPEQETK